MDPSVRCPCSTVILFECGDWPRAVEIHIVKCLENLHPDLSQSLARFPGDNATGNFFPAKTTGFRAGGETRPYFTTLQIRKIAMTTFELPAANHRGEFVIRENERTFFGLRCPLSCALLVLLVFPAHAEETLGDPALLIEQGLPGNEPYEGPGGMDFVVNAPIRVVELGAYDSGSNGLFARITVELWSRDDRGTPEDFEDDTGGDILASLEFEDDAGTLDGSTRFVPLEEAVLLEPGPYTIVAWGYGVGEEAYNVQGDDAEDHGFTITESDLITFVGQSRFGDVANTGQFPDTVDTGPATRYGAGNFRFEANGDPFQITEVNITDGDPATVTLTWPSEPGESFTVGQSTDVEHWEDIAVGYPSGGDTTTFELELAASKPDSLFWRVRRE